MMTTDPRLCLQAQRIDVIGFDEASELAYFGAKVLHPATLIPAVEKNIPVHVLNSRQPDNKGTCIRARAPRSRTVFRAIAAKKGMKVINVRSPRMLMAHGFLRALFEAFDRHACAADLVSTSEVSVSVALDTSRDVSALVSDRRSWERSTSRMEKPSSAWWANTFAAKPASPPASSARLPLRRSTCT